MAQVTLNGPMTDYDELNTRDSVERGMSPKAIVGHINTMMTELYGGSAAAVTSGVGASNGDAVSASEQGNAAVHKTVLTLTDLEITMTDATTNGSHGSHKVYDFPFGVIQVMGCTYDLTTTAGDGGLADDAALIGALGTAAVGTGNDTLTTTEANLIPSTTGTLSGGLGELKNHGSHVATALDGHTTPIDVHLNLAVPDADSSADDTVTVSGTITILWANLGDY